MTNNCDNIKIITPDTNILFNMKDSIPIKTPATYRDPLTDVWENSSLSKTFFSKKNVTLIQDKLIEGVYLKSNKKIIISRQNDDELYVIMKSIYLQYGKSCKRHLSNPNNFPTLGKQPDNMSSWLSSSIHQSKNNECDNHSQINILNQHVLNYAINQVYNEALSYLQFKKDLNQVSTPMEHPISTNIQDKQLKYFKPNYGDFFIPQNN